MIFGRKKKPLLGLEILHSLPGRVRIRVRALRYLEAYREEILRPLVETPGVEWVRISFLTRNVLIRFKPEMMSTEEIQTRVEQVISSFSLAAYKGEREKKAQLTVNERRLQEEPISEMLTRVVTESVTLLVAIWKKSNPIEGGFHRRFMTFPALTSLSLSLPIFRSGFRSLKQSRRPNADTLSATAIVSSLLAGHDVSALTIIWLADLAELLTAYTMERTRKAIRTMLSQGEEFVWRVERGGDLKKVRIEEIEREDRVVVHTGERISVDGIVEGGEASVDQASITGEFLPVFRVKGDRVFAGTVVKNGVLTVRAERIGCETAISRIVEMVEEAAHHKASIQTFADRFSAAFIPLNFALAALVYGITQSPRRALNMLIIDYSCGVRLSTATAFSGAICAAARNGILVKGSNYLEMLAQTDTLILDKTGTLTEGKPEVVTVSPADASIGEKELVTLAAAAEETSRHPLAAAVLERARASGWTLPKHSHTEVFAGRGASTRVGRSVIRVGNRRFMEENGIDVESVRGEVSRIVRRGENLIYVAKGKKIAGVLGIQDTLRENMKKSLNRLRGLGIDDILLLTGDVEQQAEIVSSRMAMDRYQAELLPEDKAETVLRLQSKGVPVVMVGDGINDAPALAYADVGIAMGGSRTDIAIEAADITIASDNPLLLPAAYRLSQKTMKIVKQNFATSIGVNTAGLVLASLGVLPVFWGAVLHNACTVAVVMNSGRLLFHDVHKDR